MSRSLKMLAAIFVIVGCATITFAEKPFVVSNSGRKSFFSKITQDSSGNLIVKSGNVSRRIKSGTYKYARVPLPSLVRKAARALHYKKYDTAISLFKKAYSEYRFLGWGDFCVYASAQADTEMGNKKQAIDGLLRLKGAPSDPDNMPYYIKAKCLMAQLYVDEAQFDKGKVVLKDLGSCNDDAVAAFSNNLLAKILMKQGKRKDAMLMYLRTVLLFSKKNTKERPEALANVVKILKEDKNNKYKTFEKMLKEDYPSSKYTKSL